MRTIQLSNENIELICQALGIAERQFIDIHKTIVEKTINVRGANESNKPNPYYQEMACKMAELNVSISDMQHDVWKPE